MLTEPHARGPGPPDRQAAGFTAICSPSSAALLGCSSSLLQWLHKCSPAPGTISASRNQATDSTHNPGATQMRAHCCDAAERLRKGRFLSPALLGRFFKLEGGTVKIKPTQNGHKGACGLLQAGQLVNTFLGISGHFPTPGSFLGPLTKSHQPWSQPHQ